MEAPQKEMICHPEHYGGSDNIYETIKVLEHWLTPKQFAGFCRGNTLKYLSRAGKKGEILEDLKKAQFYLQYEIEFYTKNSTREDRKIAGVRSNLEAWVRDYCDSCRERLDQSVTPDGQKFPAGTRVHIAKDLGLYMKHYKSDMDATVVCTYKQMYGGDGVKSYCLDIDGHGMMSWYKEHQLTEI